MKKYENLSVDDLLKEALEKIGSDREKINSLLNDLVVYIENDSSNHRYVGLIASKYIEALQRSTEQLTKTASILQKEEKKAIGEINSDDVYKMIGGLEKDKKQKK